MVLFFFLISKDKYSKNKKIFNILIKSYIIVQNRAYYSTVDYSIVHLSVRCISKNTNLVSSCKRSTNKNVSF